MAKRRDIIGQTFGQLTVISELSVRSVLGHIMIKCSCSCGNSTIVRKSSVTYGTSTSCGCIRIQLRRKIAGGVSIHTKFCAYKSSASARGYIFLLTKEQFKQISAQNCHYCNKPPAPHNRYYKLDGSLLAGRTSKESADRAWITFNGVDRKDNTIGYVIENCVPCCASCNLAKGEMSENTYIEHCRQVAIHQATK